MARSVRVDMEDGLLSKLKRTQAEIGLRAPRSLQPDPVAPTVLVCDDAPGYRLMLAWHLREADFDVSDCATWEEAVCCAGDQQPDAIVADLWMPTFEPALLQRVHDASPGSVIVIVSAYAVDISARSVAGIDGITAIASKCDHPDVIVGYLRNGGEPRISA